MAGHTKSSPELLRRAVEGSVGQLWGSGGFAVGEMGSLSLSYVQINFLAVSVASDGLLTLGPLILPFVGLRTLLSSGMHPSSHLALDAVTMPEHPELGMVRGTVTPRQRRREWKNVQRK